MLLRLELWYLTRTGDLYNGGVRGEATLYAKRSDLIGLLYGFFATRSGATAEAARDFIYYYYGRLAVQGEIQVGTYNGGAYSIDRVGRGVYTRYINGLARLYGVSSS